ncbi:hypothetical protein CPAV1605_1305 [seawater metagenome]|uniref:Uncharacterized protein n=1 Tax=seawater metagenome TaxID=1561972 RepID=A0A5E8CJG2_9ZZZZ
MKLIKIDIYRNNKLVGENTYHFENKDNKKTINKQVKFDLKFLGIKYYSFESNSIEIYQNDKLIKFSSETITNKKKYNIQMNSLNQDIIIGNWWNYKLFNKKILINPITGNLTKYEIYVGKENQIININGVDYECEYIIMETDNNNIFEFWYNNKLDLILKVSFNRRGEWKYIVKSYDQ